MVLVIAYRNQVIKCIGWKTLVSSKNLAYASMAGLLFTGLLTTQMESSQSIHLGLALLLFCVLGWSQATPHNRVVWVLRPQGYGRCHTPTARSTRAKNACSWHLGVCCKAFQALGWWVSVLARSSTPLKWAPRSSPSSFCMVRAELDQNENPSIQSTDGLGLWFSRPLLEWSGYELQANTSYLQPTSLQSWWLESNIWLLG